MDARKGRLAKLFPNCRLWPSPGLTVLTLRQGPQHYETPTSRGGWIEPPKPQKPAVTEKRADGEQRLVWHWLWVGPLCLVVLLFVEGHTVPYAFRLLKLGVYAFPRRCCGDMLSPSVYFCFCTMIASVHMPIQGLIYTAIFVTAQNRSSSSSLKFSTFSVANIISPRAHRRTASIGKFRNGSAIDARCRMWPAIDPVNT